MNSYNKSMEALTNELSVKTIKQNELVQRAFTLFYEHGFHATGVDAIVSGTGISKRTLYKYFSSKEDLVISTIQYYHQTNFLAIEDYIAERAFVTAGQKILALFDFLIDRVNGGDLRGCFATNAKSEYAQSIPGISTACSAYTDAIQQLISDLLLTEGYKNTEEIAQQIVIIFSGAVMHCKLAGNSRPSILARDVVELLLKTIV